MIKSIGWDTSFHLNGKFPLLDNSIFPSLNAAKAFVSDSTSSAIAGTIIGVDDPSNSNETGLYEIFNDSGELALRKLVSEETLSSYQTKIDSLVTDLSDNYSSELAELAGQQADQLEALRDEMFSPDNDTTPITRTMMLQVGADSTNYRFSTKESGKNDTDGIVFNSSDKSLTFLEGTLYHFSITDSLGKPRTWSISDSSRIELKGVETPLGKYMRLSDHVGKGKSLWVYLKVHKTGSKGIWLLSPTKYACILDETQSPGEGLILGSDEYYYLLYGYCGIIPAGSPFFEPVYGNTWIKGSTIYTGKVQTMDGYSKLDLDNNTLKLGNDFYYADGQVVVGNPDTGAFVFHKHGDSKTALHVGTMTKDSNGNESWNGMTFADGELTIGKYDERLHEMQTQLDKEVSTWYGDGIPLPYKENNESNTVDSVAPELVASYNETLTTDENGVKMFNLSPDPEPLPRHINDIYINSITGVGYRLVVSNWGEENQQVYWLQLSQWDLQNILNQLNGVNNEVNNIKKALDITEDGQTVIGDKFIQTMMLRIGADSTNYTLTKTSTSGNRMTNLKWGTSNWKTILYTENGETLTHNFYSYIEGEINKSTWEVASSPSSKPICEFNINEANPIYIYIKCYAGGAKKGTATWFSATSPQSLVNYEEVKQTVDGKEVTTQVLFYYFPFGTIVSPKDKTLVEVRGNTKIVGDRIITGKLESNTGNSFFDLDNGQFALGVDQSNPNDLSKAAFSFDGSTVHIGDTGMFDTQSKFVDMSDSWTIEGINNQNQIQTLPLLHLLNTKSSTLYRVENGLRASIITSTGEVNQDLTAEYIIFLATNEYSIGQNGVETWPSDVSILTPGKIFQGKDGYSIYILWGISSTQYGNGELTLSDLSERYFQDFEYDLFNYSLLIDHIHIKYYDQNEQLFPMFSTTEISGGLVLTNVLGVKDSSGKISAGICGINDENNKTAFWAGANLEEKEDAPVKLSFSGLGSAIGPLTVSGKDTITVGSDYKSQLLLSGGSSASITLQSAKTQSTTSGAVGVKKFIISSDSIDTSGTYPKTQNFSSTPTTDSTVNGTIKSSGSGNSWLTLYSGNINFSWPTPLDMYNFDSNKLQTYITIPEISMTVSGFTKNSSNEFYFSGHLDLLINGSIVKTKTYEWNNPAYEGSSKAFKVTINPWTYPSSDTASEPNKLMEILRNGNNSIQVRFRIERLSRTFTGGGRVYITGGIGASSYSDYKDLVITSSSGTIEKVAKWDATLKENADPVEESLINYSGVSFRKGSNVVVLYVGGDSLLCRLSNLPTFTGDSGYSTLVIGQDGQVYKK